MKLLLTAVLSSGAVLSAQAQQISANYSVTELGPNHRVWHAPPSALTGQTHAPVVELRSGMNYWDPDQAAWLPSQPSFVDTGDAFVASRIQHKTRLERDINVEGAVSFLTPSGSVIRATPVGIALYNRINGQFALIGTLTNSTGAIVGPGADTVLFEDAYAGVVCASVAYRVSHGSLEQDVIFTGKLDAGAYNFPTNNNTLVQVISEIYESPAPDVTRNPVYVETNLTVRSRMASPDIMDETIAYDEHFFLGRGHAYTAPSSANTNGTAAVVSKELCVTPNGTFLIESVQYGAIRDALAALPDCVPTGGHASVRPSSGLESFCAILPKPPSAAQTKLASDRKPEKLASATRLPTGLVIDFVANVAQNQPLFACDTNYIVAGTVNINVATTFEGGTVVKYQTGACLNLYGAVTCATALYRPVTLTAYDDNTVGEPVGSGNVSPSGYANPAIYMGASSLNLTNFHIRYAQIGIMSFGGVGTSLTVNDSQFLKCIQGIHIGGTGCGCGCGCGCGSLTVVLNNTLMATTTYPLSLSAGSCILNVGFYNCTVDHGSQVISGSYAYAVNVVSTNSSFTCNTSKGLGTWSGYKNGFYGNTGNWTFGTAVIQPSSSPYQIAGAGSYYLAVSSPYRNAGSVNIGPGLLADLKQRTTDPPNITYANVPISVATTFSPQFQRDIDTPDVGYHYDPLDYAVSGLTVTAPLSLINGVAVATYGTTAAMTLSGSGQLLSQGLANNLNHVVRYNTVQEQSTTAWSSSTVGDAVRLGSSTANAQCTFTAWSLLGAVGNHVNNPAYYTTPSWFAHNQFAGGTFAMNPGLVALTNCLWERVALTLNDNIHPDAWYLYNNLFRGGSLTYSLRGTGSVGKAYDNLFDHTAIIRLSSSGYFTSGYNGYVVNCSQFENSQGNNRVLTSNPDYQTGPLGRYYYPTSGNLLSSLINFGSRQAANAGLYHFTTTANQVKEGATQVDIGFHYVALDANGHPIDTDGDGLPDYVEDANGNGVVDPGETDSTNPDTDGDGLSDGAEVHYYGSDPTNPHTLNQYKFDSEYFHTAVGGEPHSLTEASLDIDSVGGGPVNGTISGAQAGAWYDLYFVNNMLAQRWQWRRVLAGIQCDNAGQAMFQLDQPDTSQAYFVILSAEDGDGDGLSDGYEAWFSYGGRRTLNDNIDTDNDLMKDGWEVEYGLVPTDATGNNGGAANPDGDAYTNLAEHNDYYAATLGYDATFDPLIAAPTQRPVVVIAPADPPTIGFTISRDGSKAGALTVYYALGGSARYGATHDYTLTPVPAGLDRICAVDIPANTVSVTVAITPTPAGLAKGPLSVIVGLTPYSVSVQPQEPNPLNWAYVADWNHNRATNYFAGKSDGFMINLHKDPATGYLTIQPTASTAPPPFVNLANSGRGTVARIEVPNPWDPSVPSSRIVGEYYTTPTAVGLGDPSRTTVDRYGNVWVANRSMGGDGAGAITKMGVVIGGTRCNADGSNNPNGGYVKHDPPNHPIIYNTCTDRDRDGLIHTSYGLDNTLAWTGTDVSGAADEAVLAYVSTTPTYVRSLAVDADNNVWVGSREGINQNGNGWQELVDATTVVPITGQKYHYGSGGYGGVVDPFGVLWSSGNGGDGVLRLDPRPFAGDLPGCAGGTLLFETSYAYGIGLDPTSGDVWAAGYTVGGVWQFKQSGCSIRWPFAASGNSSGNELKGVVVDGTGNIWVAHAGLTADPVGQEVYRFQNNGTYLGSVLLSLNGVAGKAPHGVSIDSSGKIWAVCYQPAADGHCYAMRIDPTITQGSVGTVTEAVDLGASPIDSGPYNYSDMTGFVSLAATQPAGVWDFVEDSTASDTLWSSVTLDGDLNSGNIIVEVRAADQFTGLASWPFRRLTGSTGTLPFGAPAPKGRYLEVRVTLLENFAGAQSPVVRSLSLAWGAPASDLEITAHPRSQIVGVGGSATLTVSVSGKHTPFSYQWSHDGIATVTSPSFTVNNATAADAGMYHVQVTDFTGTILQSADARLHVNLTPDLLSYPPTASVDVSDPHPVNGEAAHFTGQIDVASSPVALYYQWRKNGVPILPNGSGQCAIVNQKYTATYSIASVTCPDSGSYTVVLTNQYWKVLSTPVVITVHDASFSPVPEVTLTVAPPYSIPDPMNPVIVMTDRNQPPTLTAQPCFTGICQQWFHTDEYGGTTEPIPEGTGLIYTFPNPVSDEFLGTGFFAVEVFDAGHIPHKVRFRVIGNW